MFISYVIEIVMFDLRVLPQTLLRILQHKQYHLNLESSDFLNTSIQWFE